MKNILSIDGGGIYGVVPIAVCIEIEKELNARGFPTRDGNPAELSDVFDIFYGTSTGSIIIGTALAGINGRNAPRVRGFNAQKVKDLYNKLGPIIFGEQTDSLIIEGIPINGPKFDGVKLENELTILGKRRLGLFSIPNLNPQNKPLDVAFSAFNLSTGKPQFFRSWIDGAENGDIDVIDAILASSFAQKRTSTSASVAGSNAPGNSPVPRLTMFIVSLGNRSNVSASANNAGFTAKIPPSE